VDIGLRVQKNVRPMIVRCLQPHNRLLETENQVLLPQRITIAMLRKPLNT